MAGNNFLPENNTVLMDLIQRLECGKYLEDEGSLLYGQRFIVPWLQAIYKGFMDKLESSGQDEEDREVIVQLIKKFLIYSLELSEDAGPVEIFEKYITFLPSNRFTDVEDEELRTACIKELLKGSFGYDWVLFGGLVREVLRGDPEVENVLRELAGLVFKEIKKYGDFIEAEGDDYDRFQDVLDYEGQEYVNILGVDSEDMSPQLDGVVVRRRELSWS